jgi:hypothetical protein
VNRKIILILLVCVISTIGFAACDAQSDNSSHVPNTVSETTGTETEPESRRLEFATGDSLVAANQEEVCGTYKKGNLDITWLDLGSDVDFVFDPPILHASEGLFILPLIFKSDLYDLTFFTDFVDMTLLGWFICPVEQKDKWEPLVREMMQTIQVEGKES